MRALLSCDDSTDWEAATREIVSPLRVWAELVAIRAESLSYLGGQLDRLERLLTELPQGSLTTDDLRTLRQLVERLKRSLP